MKTEDGEKIAEEFKLTFFETSAKDGINIDETFESLAEKIDEVYSKLEKPEKEIKKNKLYNGKSKRKCC